MPGPFTVQYGYYCDCERVFDKIEDAATFYKETPGPVRLIGKNFDVDVIDDEGNAGLVDDGLSEEEREIAGL